MRDFLQGVEEAVEAHRELGWMKTIMQRSFTQPTAQVTAHSRCQWSRYWKLLPVSLSDGSKLPGQFQVRFRSGTERCNRLYHMKTRTVAIGPVSSPKIQYFDITSLAPIRCLSSDHIVTWSIPKLCSFVRSFNSRFQICDPTNIRWVAIENAQCLLQIWPNFTAIQRILIGSQIRKREVKERTKLHNVHIDHVTIQSELRYLIGAKIEPKWKEL